MYGPHKLIKMEILSMCKKIKKQKVIPQTEETSKTTFLNQIFKLLFYIFFWFQGTYEYRPKNSDFGLGGWEMEKKMDSHQ